MASRLLFNYEVSVITRSSALLLALGLALPDPAFALRGLNSESPSTVQAIQAGLEEDSEEVVEGVIRRLKLPQGQPGAVRQGKWAGLIANLEKEDPSLLRGAIVDPSAGAETLKQKKQIKGGDKGRLIADIRQVKTAVLREAEEQEREIQTAVKDILIRRRNKVGSLPSDQPPLVQWTERHFIPALTRCALTGFSDFSPLREAGRMPGRDAPAHWEETLDEMIRWWGEIHEKEPALKEVDFFYLLVHWWNEHGFSRLRSPLLFTVEGEPGEEPRVADYMVSLGLAEVLREQRVSLAGRTVPVRTVRRVVSGKSTQYLGQWLNTGAVCLWEDMLAMGGTSPWIALDIEDVPANKLIEAGIIPVIHQSRMELNAILRDRYKEPSRYRPVIEEAMFFEEIGHGLAHTLVEQKSGRQFVSTDEEYLDAFMETIYAEGGVLNGIYSDLPVEISGEMPEIVPTARRHVGMALVELFGTLVKAAMGPDPTVAEEDELSRPSEAISVITLESHAAASEWAILLEAQELQVEGAIPFSARAHHAPDHGTLAALSRRIAARPLQERRRAFWNVVRRECTPEVVRWLEQAPFPEIGINGERTPRFNYAGLEEGEPVGLLEVRLEGYLRELEPAAWKGTPVVITAGLEEKFPQLRVLAGVGKRLPLLFAGGRSPAEMATELITRWDARGALVAGLDGEPEAFLPALQAAGISAAALSPSDSTQAVLAILSAAAGIEQASLAAMERVGRFLDDLTALALARSG